MRTAKAKQTALTKILCALVAALAMAALAASSYAQSNRTNAAKSGMGNVISSPNTPAQCPEGQVMDDGKCAPKDAINYNASKSNTGNVTASPNASGHCPEGETMANGKCVRVDSINYNASKSNTGNVTASPSTSGHCPEGETMADGKCTRADKKVNNTTTRSNTQHNVTDKPDTTGKGQADMAVKGSGVPKNTTKNINDGAAKGQADE